MTMFGGADDDTRATALGFARAFNYDVPPALAAAETLRTEVDAVLAEPAVSMPPLPKTPKLIRPALHDAALARITAAETKMVAEQWARDARVTIADLVRESSRAWISSLAADFLTIIGDLTAAAARVPLGSSPLGIDVDAFTDWRAGLDLAATADQRVQVRKIFSHVFGDSPYIDHNAPGNVSARLGDLPYFGVVKMPAPNTDAQAAVREWEAHRLSLEAAANADTATRWSTWLTAANEGWLVFALPGPGEIEARISHWRDFGSIGAAAHTSDGGRSLAALMGRADHTYRVAADLVAR